MRNRVYPQPVSALQQAKRSDFSDVLRCNPLPRCIKRAMQQNVCEVPL
jgi:hypothetical protein